ncbi:hypothetical protein BN946_scf184978.g29 [Trametes cinnabarina]|uniref:Alcohol dehydrogenase-like N-terminal domain-containing protein n=1 Tax=Pycnoporus cinnabarinus TaxID=5643 RepID=A0A060SR38_PYCCI|nr:hypothetical protein BN946_scf184978.g29 [Trametes cinnabarina]
MAAPPVPPRPFEEYDEPQKPSSPPALPPLPPDFKPERDQAIDQLACRPHYEHPLAAPRPQKVQRDLPMNMAASLDERPAPSLAVDPTAFPQPTFNPPFANQPASHNQNLTFATSSPQRPPVSRGPSPLPPPQGSDWSPWSPPPPPPHSSAPAPAMPSFPQPYPQGPRPTHPHQHTLSSSFANLSLSPLSSSPAPLLPRPPQPATALPPLPPPSPPSPSSPSSKSPSSNPPQIPLAGSLGVETPNSTDPALGPAQIDDPELQKLVNVAIPIILQVASQLPPGPVPPHVAEAIYMRASCAATGIYPQFIPHDPRTAFRDFERAAKAGHHPAWFKLGREYENFNDVQHAKECFERGIKYGVESCYYRLGMAHLMGQLGFQPDPKAALPLLYRAATLATVEVPQPAYVYGLLLLNEFSHVSIPPHLFQPFLAPGVTEARRHLERAAYLNFAPAQYKLGHAYEFATPPFPFDPLLSVQYYSLASQQGEIEADMALSKWFLCGAEGAFDKDEGLAWTFAEKAARKGLPSAEFALGYYSEVGVGGPKDIETARKWYTRASQHGNTDATERLQALSQPTPQALSREQHENLTDVTLVRKRTQAKQRSEAVGGAPPPPPISAAQRSQIVNNVRKNSMRGGPMAVTAAAAYGPAEAAAGALDMSTDNAALDLAGMQRAVRWYPPAYDIRVEAVPIPQIIDPDDAIVRVTYFSRHGGDHSSQVCAEAICTSTEVMKTWTASRNSFLLVCNLHPNATGRPELYSTLRVGDKVVSPFTVSCGECHFCRVGFTCRCVHSCLFGIPTLPGGQAQFVRVPKAGGTLFSLSALQSPATDSAVQRDLSRLTDSSLILLADILPTGVFAAMQALQHPKLAPVLTGKPYPFGGFVPEGHIARGQAATALQSADRILTIAVVGLGPVGVVSIRIRINCLPGGDLNSRLAFPLQCATVSLLDILAGLESSQGLAFRVVAVDPLGTRRQKMQAVYDVIDPTGKGTGRFAVASVEDGKKLAHEWTDGAGCNAVLEVVGNNSALTLAYELVRPFGIISSVGVHQEPPLPFNGRDVYNKNVSFDFGRCPVRATFPIALDILLKRQDVFGGVGTDASLIDRIVGLDQAVEMYKLFDKGQCGKILFDPWI